MKQLSAPAYETTGRIARITLNRPERGNGTARVPVNQLRTIKLMINQSLMAQGLYQSQLISTIFDGIARHTKEGYEAEAGFKQAVKERDDPFGVPSFE